MGQSHSTVPQGLTPSTGDSISVYMTCCMNIIKIMNEAKLTSNDLSSTALAALMFVCHQALQMWQEMVKVCISMIPEKTLQTQPNWKKGGQHVT